MVNIYNPHVLPRYDEHLFENLEVSSLEFNAFYRPAASFQQLFNGSNIQCLQLSGDPIRSNLSQSFTGIIRRFEYVTRAKSLSLDNIADYPADALIIKAWGLTEFPKDSISHSHKVVELHVISSEPIPTHAFRGLSKLESLSVETEKDIDLHAFDGLTHLQRLSIRGQNISMDLLTALPELKELELDFDQLGDSTQCQLLTRLVEEPRTSTYYRIHTKAEHCTCLTAYLAAMMKESSCHARNCRSHPCSTIRKHYAEKSKTFRSGSRHEFALESHLVKQNQREVFSRPFGRRVQEEENSMELPFNSGM